MTRLAYFDCPAGIAGDMCLGALVDAGVPPDYLNEHLKKLGLDTEYSLQFERVLKNGVAATKAHVHLSGTSDHHRHLGDIQKLIAEAALPARAAEWSLRVFETLAEAEAQVHATTPAQVHFHEVGAVDAIVDVVGTCLGLDYLQIERIVCSALPTGGGLVRVAHGVMPVPTPAVVKLFEARQVPVYSNGIHRELVTPTGAAIVCALAESFGTQPAMAVRKVGLGAGDRDLPLPNIVRLWLGEASAPLMAPRMGDVHSYDHTHSHEEVIARLETQTDDLNPQVLGYLFERLLEAGAADVFTAPVGMKKSRPGTLMTVLCAPERLEICEQILYRETTTLGIRRLFQIRSVLGRRFETVETPFGPISLKVGEHNGEVLNIQPEYEDCRRLAQEHRQPLKLIQQAALNSWHRLHNV